MFLQRGVSAIFLPFPRYNPIPTSPCLICPDSYSIAFREPADAVKFCVQVRRGWGRAYRGGMYAAGEVIPSPCTSPSLPGLPPLFGSMGHPSRHHRLHLPAPSSPLSSHSPSCCWSGSCGRRACSWTRPRLQPNSCHQAAEPTLVRDQQPLDVRECKDMCTEPGREPLPLLAAGSRLFSIFSSHSKRSSKSLSSTDGEGSAHHHQRSARARSSGAGPSSASRAKGEASGRQFPSSGELLGAHGGGTLIGEDLVRPST